MVKYRENQEVEVLYPSCWRRAKIIRYEPYVHGAHEPDRYLVRYTDGTLAIFNSDKIREYDITRHKGWDGCEEERIAATD